VSLVHQAGLPELIVATESEYEKRAVALAPDPFRLQALRQGIRERMATSPLMDGRRQRQSPPGAGLPDIHESGS